MKRVQPIALLIIISCFIIVPMPLAEDKSMSMSTPLETILEQKVSRYLESQAHERAVRVAVYDEANITVPNPSVIPAAYPLTNNLSEVVALLEGAGHQVTLLTTQDILDHKLLTIDYDVFVMVNNLPRENIAKLVKEFWLGGGGLLCFNGAQAYLWYEGIVYPGISVDPYYIFWGHLSSDSQNVTSRHSTMKEYHINDIIYEREAEWATGWEPALTSTDISDDYIPLLRNITDTDLVTGFAFDNTHRGGRIVQLPSDGYSIPTAFKSIIVDSVEWLTPRPKGRIAYDLSHQPRLYVDYWDRLFTTSGTSENSFSQFRDLLVNHTYTFDKFYPSSSGNFTEDRLSKYDMIVCVWPDLNYTVAERTTIENWVNDGGNLLILGDRSGLLGPAQGDEHINFLLENFDIRLSGDNVENIVVCDDVIHPTTEYTYTLAASFRNYVNISGDADAIFMYGSNIVVGGDQYGNGRVILAGDMNIFDNGRLSLNYNAKFAVNTANWLIASKANVLLFTNDDSSGWGYRSAPSLALNDLAIPYFLTWGVFYFNLSMNLYSWDLIIFDSPFIVSTAYFEEILEFIEGGGRVLMSYYNVDSVTSPLWIELGFGFSEDMPDDDPLYIWESSHPIFNIPNEYGASNFTSFRDIGDEGDLLVPAAGATALAGNTESAEAGKAQIIIANDDQTLYNGFLIDQLTGDIDDSTYMDSFEFWENEIALMTRPVVDSPSNVTYEGGTTGHTILWAPRSTRPSSYVFLIDGEEESSGVWDGSVINTNIDGLTPGTHEVTLVATDTYGFSDNSTTYVIVYDTILPTLNSPADIEVAAGSTVTVTWDANDLFPATYRLYINGTQEKSSNWDGSDISVSMNGLEVGTYNFTIMAIDTSGNNASDTVWVTVTQGLFGLDITTLILIGAAGVVVVIIVAALAKRRGGSTPTSKPAKQTPKKKTTTKKKK